MTKGLDCYGPLTQNIINAIPESEKYDFIGRYYSRDNKGKELTIAEAKLICNSGRSIVSIYQDANNYAAAFHTDNGTQDGAYAWQYAQYMGQATETPIYFAVDFNIDNPAPGETKQDTLKRIYDYFKAIQIQFGIWNNKSPLNYKIGIYGCGEICQYIKQQCGLASYSWLTMSKAWPGYATYDNPAKYNIKQLVEVKYSNMKFDTNESGNGSFGSWRI